MLKPYIGICDFLSGSQALAMARLLSAESHPLSLRQLMVGVMISRKTLNGIESKWTAVWPPKEQLAGIFVQHHRVFNTLHYADDEGVDVLLNLMRATHFGGPNLNAVQLDMIWPDPDSLFIFGDARPDLKVILQINSRAFAAVNDDPIKLRQRLETYSGALDYVLLDKSMRRGLGLDAVGLLPYLRELHDRLPDLGLTVAGGLGPNTLDLIEPIVKEFPGVSIDAQGQLRSSGNALDPIDWGRAALYLKQAIKLFAGEVSII
ncbi:hypothetical protein KKF05_03270 [Patescibacteria group bacterium]|nr:hypothetical protein [Patescibacteria group bacterium]MBU1915631.1 hypothetical protein [Patescibacteria group bacterium]